MNRGDGNGAAVRDITRRYYLMWWGYAFAGGIGLFAFVLDIEFRYFQSSLGFAVSLVISGLVLLGIALLLARLVPRLRR